MPTRERDNNNENDDNNNNNENDSDNDNEKDPYAPICLPFKKKFPLRRSTLDSSTSWF